MEARSLREILNPENRQAPFLETAATKADLTVEEVEEKLSFIKPTEKEKALGMLYAYRLAADRYEKESKQRANAALDAEALRMWSYGEIRTEMRKLAEQSAFEQGFSFELDEHNEKAFKLLCFYFTNNPEFEEYCFDGMDYSLRKGIWLQSPTRGTGKSFLLRLFARNKRNSFHYQHVPELRTILLRDPKTGIDEIEKRTTLQPCSVQRINFFQQSKGFMYDELFGEEKANFMGNPFSISEFIIQRLYDQRKEENWFWKFHVTSNYSGQEIEDKCGLTVRSRMIEMFNLIKIEGPDRRKKIKR